MIITISCSIELNCTFIYDTKFGYVCKTKDLEITDPSMSITKISGKHFYNRKDKDVTALWIWKQEVEFLPANITEHFPMLRTLLVKSSNLKNLTRRHELNILRKLFLGFNKIVEIPLNYFWNFCSLQQLSLFNNEIISLHRSAFRDLVKLEKLWLNGNRLEELDLNLFRNCYQLKEVFLRNNHLKTIETSLFETNTLLQKIDLRNNQIKAIGLFLLDHLVNIQVVLFSENPCIQDSFPETNLEDLKTKFANDCPTPPPPPTTKATKKISLWKGRIPPPKIEIIYFENCNWTSNMNSRYF